MPSNSLYNFQKQNARKTNTPLFFLNKNIEYIILNQIIDEKILSYSSAEELLQKMPELIKIYDENSLMDLKINLNEKVQGIIFETVCNNINNQVCPTTFKTCPPIVTCSKQVINQYHVTKQPYIHNYHTEIVHHYVTQNEFIPNYTCNEVHVNEPDNSNYPL